MRRSTKLILLFLSFSFITTAQNTSTNGSHYNWYDAIVGVENTGLYVGYEYKDQFRITEDFHKFFQSHDFITGNLTYNGQPYYDQQLKYNLFDDELIIKLRNKGGETIMQLIKDDLYGFSINGHQFVKFSNIEDDKGNDAFYEVLRDHPSVKLLKRHSKRRIKKLDKNVIYYEYKDRKPLYFIVHENVSYEVRSKKDFLNIFPEHKEEIRNLASGSKRAQEEELKRLSDLINQLKTQ
jgi:hypothetical protein